MRNAFFILLVWSYDADSGGAYALSSGRILQKNIKMPDPVRGGPGTCSGAPPPPPRARPRRGRPGGPAQVPPEGVAAAAAAMESGRLFRYNVASAGASETSRCEAAFAAYTGHRFALGLNSCGSAILPWH